MSVRVLSLVWDNYPGGGSELLALLALADWSDDEGRCWPSIPSVARKVRLSPDQARRVVHRLIESDYLSVTAGKTGGGSSRRYQIRLDRLTPCADATPSGGARGSADASPPLAPMQGHPLHSYASRTVIDTLKTHQAVAGRLPVSSETADLSSAWFDQFWTAYPKKRSKGGAEKAWKKLKPDAELLDRILKAIAVAKTRDDWRKNGGQFIPYPATWLNARGWEDDAPAATTASQVIPQDALFRGCI